MMLISVPRHGSITRLAALIGLALACSKGPRATAQDAALAKGSGVADPAAAAPGSAEAPPSTIRSVTPKPSGVATRCVLGGEPLASACIGGGSGIAVDRAGMLYVVADRTVRRYTRIAGDACRFEPSGAPIAMPPDNPRPQSIDGQLYLRSGGAAWGVIAAGDAVYAHDFLGGLYRIDRGKAEPACLDVFGYGSVVAMGKRLLVARKGIEQLAPGKSCKASSAKIDDKGRGELSVIRGQLYASNGGEIWRYDGPTPVQLDAAGTRICHVTSLTACGEGLCAVDNNCMQMIQFDAGGKLLRTFDADALFAARPWSLQRALTTDRGAVLLVGRHRDTSGDKERCETVLYELPAAVFAR